MMFYVAREKRALMGVRQVETNDPNCPVAFVAMRAPTSRQHLEEVTAWGAERRKEREEQEGDYYRDLNARLVECIRDLLDMRNRQLTGKRTFGPGG